MLTFSTNLEIESVLGEILEAAGCRLVDAHEQAGLQVRSIIGIGD
jgi:hypothetical protein